MAAFRANGIVTLTTDFGLREPFVGIMKGMMLAHASQLRSSIRHRAERLPMLVSRRTLTCGVLQPAVRLANWLARSPTAQRITSSAFVVVTQRPRRTKLSKSRLAWFASCRWYSCSY